MGTLRWHDRGVEGLVSHLGRLLGRLALVAPLGRRPHPVLRARASDVLPVTRTREKEDWTQAQKLKRKIAFGLENKKIKK